MAKPLKKKSSPAPAVPAEELARVELLPLSEVRRWPRNPKTHDKPTIKASFARFGFKSPLLRDDRSAQLVAGHGRLEVLLEAHAAGEAPPRGIPVRADGEWMVPVLCGMSFENEQEAEAYLLVDNRASENGGWDINELSSMLSTVGDTASLGWSTEQIDDIAAIVAATNGDRAQPEAPAAFPQVDESIKIEHTCPKCGYEWSGKK